MCKIASLFLRYDDGVLGKKVNCFECRVLEPKGVGQVTPETILKINDWLVAKPITRFLML